MPIPQMLVSTHDKRILLHALVSILPGLVTLVPADHQGQVLPTPDLLAVVTNRQHSLDLVRTGATVLEAGQLALVLVRTIRPDLATHRPAFILVMPGVPGVAGQLAGVATGQPG